VWDGLDALTASRIWPLINRGQILVSVVLDDRGESLTLSLNNLFVLLGFAHLDRQGNLLQYRKFFLHNCSLVVLHFSSKYFWQLLSVEVCIADMVHDHFAVVFLFYCFLYFLWRAILWRGQIVLVFAGALADWKSLIDPFLVLFHEELEIAIFLHDLGDFLHFSAILVLNYVLLYSRRRGVFDSKFKVDFADSLGDLICREGYGALRFIWCFLTLARIIITLV